MAQPPKPPSFDRDAGNIQQGSVSGLDHRQSGNQSYQHVQRHGLEQTMSPTKPNPPLPPVSPYPSQPYVPSPAIEEESIENTKKNLRAFYRQGRPEQSVFAPQPEKSIFAPQSEKSFSASLSGQSLSVPPHPPPTGLFGPQAGKRLFTPQTGKRILTPKPVKSLLASQPEKSLSQPEKILFQSEKSLLAPPPETNPFAGLFAPKPDNNIPSPKPESIFSPRPTSVMFTGFDSPAQITDQSTTQGAAMGAAMSSATSAASATTPAASSQTKASLFTPKSPVVADPKSSAIHDTSNAHQSQRKESTGGSTENGNNKKPDLAVTKTAQLDSGSNQHRQAQTAAPKKIAGRVTPQHAPLASHARSNSLRRYLSALNMEDSGMQADTTSMHTEVEMTPLLSMQVKEFVATSTIGSQHVLASSQCEKVSFSQYALLGREIDSAKRGVIIPDRSPVLLNTNTPWSAFLCGSQGSGKSYTLSCMLENCMLPINGINKLPKPLAGVLFHYDPHQGLQPCEAAFLSSHMPVTVLVSPSSYHDRAKVYKKIRSGKINVRPLLFQAEHINMKRMLQLMAFGDGDQIPLYMEVVIRILRDMSMKRRGTSTLDWTKFRNLLSRETDMTTQQKSPLKLRLDLLDSFMAHSYNVSSAFSIPDLASAAENHFSTQPGSLTIVDLTDPFVDAPSACALFDICLGLFLEHGNPAGTVYALDEAHKFLTENAASAVFTESLMQLIREQRHRGARVIISTQEPTLSPKLLDLCTMTFVHRFTSPAWLKALASHLAGISKASGGEDDAVNEIFEEIVNLRVGESVVFSPAAMLDVLLSNEDKHGINGRHYISKLGASRIKMRTRTRVTSDGGGSIMATTGGPSA